jgi:hypothetical protein
VVAAILVAGPSEVLDQEVWSYMRARGIWGIDKWLDISKDAEVKKGILKWFREKVIWGSVKPSVLLQVFY